MILNLTIILCKRELYKFVKEDSRILCKKIEEKNKYWPRVVSGTIGIWYLEMIEVRVCFVGLDSCSPF